MLGGGSETMQANLVTSQTTQFPTSYHHFLFANLQRRAPIFFRIMKEVNKVFFDETKELVGRL
jgi:hypothetical protein